MRCHCRIRDPLNPPQEDRGGKWEISRDLPQLAAISRDAELDLTASEAELDAEGPPEDF